MEEGSAVESIGRVWLPLPVFWEDPSQSELTLESRITHLEKTGLLEQTGLHRSVSKHI